MIGKVSSLYELTPGKVYVVLVEGKSFSYNLAHALLQQVEEMGVDFNIHVVGTFHPKSIQIHEENNQ